MAGPYGPYLQQPVDARVLLVGDSNVVFCAEHVVQAAQNYPGGALASCVVCEFGATQPGIGLRDLGELGARITALDLGRYDCAVVNLGAGDLLLEDAQWPAFFNGPPHYRDRVQALLGLLAPLPLVYWIGLPQGLTHPACHPWEIAAVDLSIACFDLAFPQYHVPGWTPDPRLHYVIPDGPTLGLGPLTVDGVHYNALPAMALYTHVFQRIRAEL